MSIDVSKGTYRGVAVAPANTANRTYTFPDEDGTVVLGAPTTTYAVPQRAVLAEFTGVAVPAQSWFDGLVTAGYHGFHTTLWTLADGGNGTKANDAFDKARAAGLWIGAYWRPVTEWVNALAELSTDNAEALVNVTLDVEPNPPDPPEDYPLDQAIIDGVQAWADTQPVPPTVMVYSNWGLWGDVMGYGLDNGFPEVPLWFREIEPGGDGGPAVYDAASSGSTGAGGSTSLTFSHTCSADDNRLLLVYMTVESFGDITTVTYDGEAMTLLATEAGTGSQASIYGILDPATGANNVVISSSPSQIMSAGAVSFSNARQSLVFDGSQIASDEDSVNPDLTDGLDATADDIVALFAGTADATSATATLGTERFDEDGTASGLLAWGATQPGPGTPTNLTVDFGGAAQICWIIIKIEPEPPATEPTTWGRAPVLPNAWFGGWYTRHAVQWADPVDIDGEATVLSIFDPAMCGLTYEPLAANPTFIIPVIDDLSSMPHDHGSQMGGGSAIGPLTAPLEVQADVTIETDETSTLKVYYTSGQRSILLGTIDAVHTNPSEGLEILYDFAAARAIIEVAEYGTAYRDLVVTAASVLFNAGNSGVGGTVLLDANGISFRPEGDTDYTQFARTTDTAGTVIFPSAGGTVLYDVVGTTYSPTLTQSSSNPTMGASTLTGRYTYTGHIGIATVQLTIGAGWTAGTGAFQITLPFTAAAGTGLGSMWILDNTTTHYVGVARLISTTLMQFYITGNANAVNETNPMTWAAGDILEATISVELA
jgi:hypothetical protein